MSSGERAGFEDVWKTLGIAEAETIVGTEMTIRPDTFADSGAARARRAEPAEPAAALTLPSLPRISLAHQLEVDVDPVVGQAAGGNKPGADLEVTGLLGQGGMGRVLLARQRSLGRDVAIKMVRPEAVSPEATHALLAEAIVTGSLEHPSIIPVHALGCDDAGHPLLVMKRIEGVAWRALLANPHHPAWSKVEGAASDEDDDGDGRLLANLRILMSAATALHFAHTRGVVHRDLKPENVMIGGFGEIYVVDWGIAMRVDTTPADAPAPPRGSDSSLAGTPAYMAPEMVQGDVRRIKPRTDVYLLGAVLHELLTGEPRHEGSTLYEVLANAWTSSPVAYPDTIPAELGALANRATAADPDARFPDALAFRQALADYLRHRGSIHLAREAATRLAEARALRAAAAPDARRLHQLATESRFGFTQALREWSRNAEARAGLEACLELMAEIEIDNRNAAGARTLLAERTAPPPPELTARLAALEEELRVAAEREARMRQLERDQDLSVGRRQRIWVFLTLIALGVGIGVFTAWHRHAGDSAVTLRDMLRYLVALMICVGIVTALGWRQLLGTAINRRILATLYIFFVASLVHRLLALRLGMTVAEVIVGDLVLSTALVAAAALTIQRAFVWVVPFPVAGAALATWYPRFAPLLFTVTMLATIIGSGFAVLNLKQRR